MHHKKLSRSAATQIRAFRRQHAQYEKRAARAFYLAIRAQIRGFLMQGEGVDPNTIKPDPIIKAFQRVWLTIGKDYGAKVYDRMLREESGKGWMPDMLHKDEGQGDPEYTKLINEYLKLHGAKKIAGITETTREWVRQKLSEGHEQGLLYPEISRNMINDQINGSRAMLIARTESTGAMNFASFIAINKSAFQKEKEWIDTADARVRPAGKPSPFDHHHEDIGKQPLEKAFFVSGEQLMFPGDTSLGASAGNICNCRCSFGVKTMRDANGRMIRKPVDASGAIATQPPLITQLQINNVVSGSSLTDIVYQLLGISLAGNLGNLIGDLLNTQS